MTGQTLAFWARYRGGVDPQRNDLSTTYTYTAYFYGPNDLFFSPSLSFSVLGPPQLTKERYIELRWNTPPGLVGIAMTLAINGVYQGT